MALRPRVLTTLRMTLRAVLVAAAVGGGVVLDSTPEDELLETRIKATAFLRVLGAADEILAVEKSYLWEKPAK